MDGEGKGTRKRDGNRGRAQPAPLEGSICITLESFLSCMRHFTFTCITECKKVSCCATACLRPHYLNVTMLGFYRQNLDALRDCLIRQLFPGGPRGALWGCKALLEGTPQQWGDGD